MMSKPLYMTPVMTTRFDPTRIVSNRGSSAPSLPRNGEPEVLATLALSQVPV